MVRPNNSVEVSGIMKRLLVDIGLRICETSILYARRTYRYSTLRHSSAFVTIEVVQQRASNANSTRRANMQAMTFDMAPDPDDSGVFIKPSSCFEGLVRCLQCGRRGVVGFRDVTLAFDSFLSTERKQHPHRPPWLSSMYGLGHLQTNLSSHRLDSLPFVHLPGHLFPHLIATDHDGTRRRYFQTSRSPTPEQSCNPVLRPDMIQKPRHRPLFGA